MWHNLGRYMYLWPIDSKSNDEIFPKHDTFNATLCYEDFLSRQIIIFHKTCSTISRKWWVYNLIRSGLERRCCIQCSSRCPTPKSIKKGWTSCKRVRYLFHKGYSLIFTFIYVFLSNSAILSTHWIWHQSSCRRPRPLTPQHTTNQDPRCLQEPRGLNKFNEWFSTFFLF